MGYTQEQNKLQEELKKHLKESKISKVSIEDDEILDISFSNGTDVIQFEISTLMDEDPTLYISKDEWKKD